MKRNNIFLLILLAIGVSSCKTPQATQVNSRTRLQLPTQYNGDTLTAKTTPTSWKMFFTDPQLKALIDSALVNNQDLKITLQQIAVAKSGMIAAKGAMLPSLSVGAEVGVSKAGRYTSEGAGNASTEMTPGKLIPDPLMNYHPGLAFDWELDLFGKLKSSKKAAVERYLATLEGQNAVRASLISQVASNYYTLLALDNKLALIHKYIDLQRQAEKIAEIQKEADSDTELAVEKFKAELAKARSQEFALKQEITECENALNLLLGRYPTPIQRDAKQLLNEDVKTIVTGLPSNLLSHRPDIRQAEHELAAAHWDIETARKAFLPSVNISATLGLEAFNPTYLTRMPKSLAYSVVGGLTAPLINRKAIEANFQQADAAQLQALYEYDKTLLTAYSEVCTLLSKHKNLAAYYALKEEEVKTLEHSVEVSHQLYMNGRATYLDVLEAERDALDAQIELLETRQQQLSCVVDLYRSLGE